MIQLSNTTAQVLTPTGATQALTFDRIIHRSCCRKNECFTEQLPTSIRLTGGCGAKYKVEFHANISGAEGDVLQLFLALEGQPLPETEMRVTPTGAVNSNNVSAGTYVVLTCSDIDRLSVINGGTTNVAVAPNATLLIRRVA